MIAAVCRNGRRLSVHEGIPDGNLALERHLFGPPFRGLGLRGIAIDKPVFPNLTCSVVDQALATRVAREGSEQERATEQLGFALSRDGRRLKQCRNVTTIVDHYP